MPVYDYHCPDCGTFEVMRRMENRDAPAVCPHCGLTAGRVMLATPSLPSMAKDTRRAMETNERARHEPKSSSQHPRGCSCCGHKSSGRAASGSQPPAPKSFANRRPWMISH